ncbi:hypothetical protein G039_0310630 [Pseudomonas aeruginosa VRFPA01]|nr:hypothetical protein G039_0310630 [Pseudomonas aeruginosa VRFPA01]
MLQQPAGGDDLAALDQRDFRVQQLERQHQPEVVLQPLVLGHLAQAGEQPGRQADVLGPGDDRPAQQVVEGLRPVLGLGRGQGEDRRLTEAPGAEGDAGAFGVVLFAVRRGRRVHRLAVQPGLYLRPLPALVAVAREQAAQQQVQLRVEVVGQRHAVGQHVDQEGVGVDAFEAGAAGQLLQQDHAQAPPVGSRRHAAGDRLGGHVAAGLQRRDDIQVELRQARRAEAADHQVQRLVAAHQQAGRAQVAVAQAGLVEHVQGVAQLADHVAHRLAVLQHGAEVGEAAAGEFLDHFVGALVPAAGGEDFRHVFARQAADHVVDRRVRLGTRAIQGEHRLAGAFRMFGQVALAHAVAAGDLPQQTPAVDQGFRDPARRLVGLRHRDMAQARVVHQQPVGQVAFLFHHPQHAVEERFALFPGGTAAGLVGEHQGLGEQLMLGGAQASLRTARREAKSTIRAIGSPLRLTRRCRVAPSRSMPAGAAPSTGVRPRSRRTCAVASASLPGRPSTRNPASGSQASTWA